MGGLLCAAYIRAGMLRQRLPYTSWVWFRQRQRGIGPCPNCAPEMLSTLSLALMNEAVLRSTRRLPATIPEFDGVLQQLDPDRHCTEKDAVTTDIIMRRCTLPGAGCMGVICCGLYKAVTTATGTAAVAATECPPRTAKAGLPAESSFAAGAAQATGKRLRGMCEWAVSGPAPASLLMKWPCRELLASHRRFEAPMKTRDRVTASHHSHHQRYPAR